MVEQIQLHRSFYADLITSRVGVSDNRKLRDALASTPREKFLGPGP